MDTPWARAVRVVWKIPASHAFAYEKEGVFFFTFCDSIIKVDVPNKKATETRMGLRLVARPAFVTVPWKVK